MTLCSDTETTPRVSQLATDIQRALRSVGAGWVEGEVQKLKRVGGHAYFTLADENATIDCCVWRSRADRIQQWPDAGALVQVHFEKVDFYARAGRTSLHVDRIRLTGEGELLARKQATLDKLTAEGFVARARRPLPQFPRRVGVIAARDSDAKHDVIKALRERWPAVHIVHRPAFVEGVHAVDSVVDALAHLQDLDAVDVIIVARGGGGVRDLVAFDDERLCRAVFACAVPVVTSIGHTAQRPNCDHVSAAYADVPARTAELVVPSAMELTAELDRHAVVMENVTKLLAGLGRDVESLWSRVRPRAAVERREAELDHLDVRLQHAAANFHGERYRTLDEVRHRLAHVRAAVPAPAVLDLAAQQMEAAARHFFAGRVAELDAAERRLDAARTRMPTPQDVAARAARLGPALLRARRRVADFERALSRMREEADKTFERQLRQHDREVQSAGAELSTRTRRRLLDASSRLAHVVELIEAKDFRRSGWLLAGDADGNPVRSATGMAPGDALSLHFHDGRADATVNTVHHEQGATHG